MKNTLLLLGCLALALPAQAEDPGSALARPCAACHGDGGNKPIANYPKLAGQSEKYLLYAMKAYQNGTRADPVMAAQMGGLSADDLAALAAHFAAQPGDLQ